MKMTPIQEKEIRAMLNKKVPIKNLPDMCWKVPLGYVCIFLNGRVISNPQLAWQIYKEERASRTVSIEEFHSWLADLPRPSLPIIKDVLSACSNREVSVPEMGRMVAAASDWKTI